MVVEPDRDVVRIVERRCRSLVGRLVEPPCRRRELPDKFIELVTVGIVPSPPALRGEVVLIPPPQLGPRRQRLQVRFTIDDEIPAHAYNRFAAIWPERRHDTCRARTPIEAADDGALDA